MTVRATSITHAQSGNDSFQMVDSAGAASPIGSTSTYAFTGSYTVGPVALSHHKAFALQCVVSGSGAAATGKMQVSGSLDGVTWSGIGSLVAIAGNGGYLQNFDAYAVKYVKCFVTASTGPVQNVTSSVWLGVI